MLTRIEDEIRIMQDNMDEIKRLSNLMYTELNWNRNYPVTIDGITYALARWRAAKDGLIQMFSKHPNWNPDSYMIQFDKDWERELNLQERNNFCDWMMHTIHLKLRENDYEDEEISFIRELYDRLYRYIFDCLNGPFICSSTDGGCFERLRSNVQTFNAVTGNTYMQLPEPALGMKTSRYIRQVCKALKIDTASDFEREFAKFADGMNPIIVKRHTCISLNPLDFILAGNGNSWRSCYTVGNFNYDSDEDYSDLDRPGEHIEGNITYMEDEVSFVMYTVNSNYNGDRIELQPKVTRVFNAYKDGALLQQRVYPKTNDSSDTIYEEHRKCVQKVIADCIGQPDMWRVSNGNDAWDKCRRYPGFMGYPDWQEQSPDLIHISYITSMPKIGCNGMTVGGPCYSLDKAGELIDLYGRITLSN